MRDLSDSLDTSGNLLFIVCFAYILARDKNTVANNRGYPAELTKRERSMLEVFNYYTTPAAKKVDSSSVKIWPNRANLPTVGFNMNLRKWLYSRNRLYLRNRLSSRNKLFSRNSFKSRK